eukprot:443329_1
MYAKCHFNQFSISPPPYLPPNQSHSQQIPQHESPNTQNKPNYRPHKFITQIIKHKIITHNIIKYKYKIQKIGQRPHVQISNTNAFYSDSDISTDSDSKISIEKTTNNNKHKKNNKKKKI